MTVSLKSEILEKLELKKSKAKKTPLKEQAKQQRQPARPARKQVKKGDKMLYEGKTVTLASYNPETGMAVVNRGRKSQIIVRARDLKAPKQLNEGVLGLAPISPTYVDRPVMTQSFEPLRPEDIGLFFEDEFTGDDDEQEDVADNGSNIRYDGHTGRKEVDELPTPSDTIAPAYSSDKPPKEISKPLSTEPGFTVAKDPDFDGYDYPADAPEIPTADFAGADAGNPRAPDQDAHYEPESDDGGKKEEVEETYLGFNKLKNRLDHKSKIRNPAAVAAGIGNKKYGKKMHSGHPMESFAFITNVVERWHGDDEDVEDRRAGRDRDKSSYRDERKAKEREREQQMEEQLIRERWHGDDENADDRRSGKDRDKKSYRNERKAKEREREQQMEQLIREMDDLLGNGEDREPKSGETITVTLPAMASIVCTVAHRMGADVHEGGQDYTLLRSMIEALAEFGHGSSSGCIDVPDLQAVAAHINGEESHEMHNRDEGHPDHQGMDMHGEEEHHEPADNWPGDMEKSRTGKTKLFQSGFSESGDFYGYEDIVAETRLTDEQELRLIKKRAGLKFW